MQRALKMATAVGLCSAFVAGCADTTVSKTQTKVTTPGGTTTTTTERKIDKTGDKAPAPKPN